MAVLAPAMTAAMATSRMRFFMCSAPGDFRFAGSTGSRSGYRPTTHWLNFELQCKRKPDEVEPQSHRAAKR
jgi:hypothetical protein